MSKRLGSDPHVIGPDDQPAPFQVGADSGVCERCIGVDRRNRVNILQPPQCNALWCSRSFLDCHHQLSQDDGRQPHIVERLSRKAFAKPLIPAPQDFNENVRVW